MSEVESHLPSIVTTLRNTNLIELIKYENLLDPYSYDSFFESVCVRFTKNRISTFVDLLSQCLHKFSSGGLFSLTQVSSSTFSLLQFCGSGPPYSNHPFSTFRVVPSLSLVMIFIVLTINWSFPVLCHVCTLGHFVIVENFAEVFDYFLSNHSPPFLIVFPRNARFTAYLSNNSIHSQFLRLCLYLCKCTHYASKYNTARFRFCLLTSAIF
jgi:hypothetical protein